LRKYVLYQEYLLWSTSVNSSRERSDGVIVEQKETVYSPLPDISLLAFAIWSH
jgi:hypothetical protein